MTEVSEQTLLEVLTSDHAAIMDLLEQVDGHRVAEASRREQLVIQTVRHLVAEEQHLWPLVRRQLPHGAELSDSAFAAHRAIEDSLRGLENPHADREFLAVALATVRRQLLEHVTEQQEQLFPHLAAQVDRAELLRLSDEAVGAEQLAPTRPRTVAPENPALNKVSSLVEGFIDQVRDSYGHRGVATDEIE